MESTRPSLSSDIAAPGRDPIVVPALINGQDEILSSTFDVIGPYSNSLVWKASDARPEDAVRAVEAAEAAFPIWSKVKPPQRNIILNKVADLMEERKDELGALMRTEMGADMAASMGFVVPLGIRTLRACASRAITIEGTFPVPHADGQSAIVHQVPVGPVLGIVPWNAPACFASRSIGTALAAGCTTVIKGSEMTPRSYHALVRCYIDAGVPPGVVNLISCSPENAADVVRTMIEHPAIRKVNYTGSTATGRKVAITCAQNLKPSVMELGGKNSAIVLDDANLETAATQCLLGGLLNGGQICMSTDRILVQSQIAERFTETLKTVMAMLFPESNPAPTVFNAASRDRLLKLIEEAKKEGAVALEIPPALNGTSNGTANGTSNESTSEKGVFMRPVLLQNVKESTRVWQEEMFGSAIAIKSVADEDEAVRITNDSGYGLSSSVFTEDLRRGMRVARRIEAGFVHINHMTVQDDPAIPFGGVGLSGWGRFNNRQGIEEFLMTKTVTWME